MGADAAVTLATAPRPHVPPLGNMAQRKTNLEQKRRKELVWDGEMC